MPTTTRAPLRGSDESGMACELVMQGKQAASLKTPRGQRLFHGAQIATSCGVVGRKTPVRVPGLPPLGDGFAQGFRELGPKLGLVRNFALEEVVAHLAARGFNVPLTNVLQFTE